MTDYEQADLLSLCYEARDEGVKQADEATDEWERRVIDQAIRAMVERGRPFTANDTRPLLPLGVKGNRVSARFLAWSKSGRIVKTGRRVTSTDPGTHAAEIREWIGADFVRSEVA